MKALHPTTLKHSVLLGALLLAAPSLQATLLVYEGFNYGLADNATIHNAAGTGTGTQGNWTVTNVTGSSSVYQTTGLSFGSNFLTSAGGAFKQSSTWSTANTNQTTATLRLDTTTTGTLWSSYLVSYTTISTSNGGFARQGVSTDTAGTTVNLLSQVYSNTLASDRKLGSGYDATPTASSNTAFATGTNYLFISSFTNVGTALSAGTTGVATTWVFTQTGYDNWVTVGGSSQSALDTYAFKKMADAAVTSGTYGFDSVGYLTFQTNSPDQGGHNFTAIYDELRYGTELSDVVSAVPEPSTYAAIFGTLTLATAAFRRRSRSA